MIIVTDDYIYHNIGNDPITSILVQVPYKYLSNLGSFLVYGDDGKQLTADRLPYDGSGFIKWRIYLNIPLKAGHTVSMQTKSTFFNLHFDYGAPQDGTNGHVNFEITKYPSAPYYIQSCNVTITCDQYMTYYDSSGVAYTSSVQIVENTEVAKDNITTLHGRYNMSESGDVRSPSLSSVKFPQIQREIRIDPWGYMYIHEMHLIENIGPEGNFRITTYTFDVPSDAEDVYIFDSYGRLAFSLLSGNTKNVSINFDENRYTLQKGENAFYWVTYRIPLSDYTKKTGDKMKLDFDLLFGTFNCLVEHFDITVYLPKDASIIQLSSSVDSVETEGKSIALIFNETDITPLNSYRLEIEIDLSKSYFDILSRPLVFLLAFGILCSSYVVSKRVLPSEERLFRRATVVPTPILLEFCSLFEEKTSLVTEIEKLDDNLKKHKIKKRLYRSQRKTAEKKIAELDKDIAELKISLKEAGGRFSQIVNELEINEAQRQSAKDGLYNLEQRYLRKKISVVAYQKLRKDLLNRHKKSKTKIDKLIFELREILS